MGFIEQMLGMETPPKANPYGRQLMDRGSVTAEPAPEPTLENALMNSPLGTFLQYKAADVPGKLQSGLQAVGDSYKKNIDYMLDPRLSQQALMGNQEEMRRMVRPAMELASDAMGGGFLANGLTKARKGGFEAGMFAGRQAKTADKAALETAQDLTAKGADKNQVWKETGWYKDVDGQWKFEIDDSGLSVGDDVKGGITHGWTERDLPHPELQRAYPDLNVDSKLTVDGFSDQPTGHYQPYIDRSAEGLFDLTPELHARAADRAGVRSVGGHELQHVVQGKEGFAHGGNTGEFASGPMFDDNAKSLQAALSQEITGGISSRPAEILETVKYADPAAVAAIAKKHGFETADEALAFLKYQDDRRTPFGQYRRLAGEAEARNVQTRMDYTPEQRRATPPWDTLDVPEDELIVRMGGGGRSMSDSRAKVGGEMGVNGFNYKGGQFLPSTDAPPGTWRVKKGKKSTTISGTRELVEPGKIENAPTPFSRSLMQLMGSGGEVYGGKAHLLDNPGYWNYMGGDTPGKLRYKDLAESASEYTVQDLVDMYNKGMRWIELDPVDGVEIVARGIKK